jgi:peptidoglycan/LPS O-acetylase OafA/YrhL
VAPRRDTGERPGAAFERVPALDGLRAVAVLAVLAFHGGLSGALPGGFLGVDTFFVLSGFLITSLLVAEWAARGSLDLGAFWARRARRLLPALVLLLVGVAIWTRLFAGATLAPELRLDELSTLFYVANWHFIAAGSHYFVQTGPPSPLLPTWSLAVEEQFYLLWPLVVLAVLRRSRTLWPLLGVAATGAVASALEMALLVRPGATTRVYFGTDTHAQSLLVGATAAVAVALWRQHHRAGRAGHVASSRARRLLGSLALLGAIGTALLWWRLSAQDLWTFQGGIGLAALASAAVIVPATLAPAGLVARLLRWSPLRALGQVSYALYLWHYPFDLWLTHADTGLFGWPLLGVRTAVALLVATASTLLVEQPLRAGRLLRSLRAWVLGPAALTATAVLVVAVTAVPVSAAPIPSALPRWPPTPSGPPVRVLLVGDSVALTLGLTLLPYQGRADVAITDAGLLGCGVAEGNLIRLHGQVDQVAGPGPGGTGAPGTCRVPPGPGGETWAAYWRQRMAQVHPQVVVLLAGRWETLDRTTPAGRWTSILDPSYQAYLRRMLQQAVQVATGQGARMVIETSPCFDTGEQPDGAPWPSDDPRRVALYNQLVEEVAAEHPGTVTVQHLHALVCPDGRYEASIDGVPIREVDGIHFTYQGPPDAGTVLAPLLLPLWYRLGAAVYLSAPAGR